jgi:streptogramin lyase
VRGAFTEYVGITSIVSAGGNLWFTEGGGFRVGRISPRAPNTVTEWSVPVGVHDPIPLGIVADGDRLYFAEGGNNTIASISAHAGDDPLPVTEITYPVPTGSLQAFNGRPQGLGIGPDHSIWIAQFLVSDIGRLSVPAQLR